MCDGGSACASSDRGCDFLSGVTSFFRNETTPAGSAALDFASVLDFASASDRAATIAFLPARVRARSVRWIGCTIGFGAGSSAGRAGGNGTDASTAATAGSNRTGGSGTDASATATAGSGRTGGNGTNANATFAAGSATISWGVSVLGIAACLAGGGLDATTGCTGGGATRAGS